MTTNTVVDLTENRIYDGDILFFVPDTRGFGNQLGMWWSQFTMETSSSVNWGLYPSFQDFSAFCMSALVCYCHLVHNRTYVNRSVVTESATKIALTWGELRVPRYLRDMMREMCRPMYIGNVTLVPYFEPLRPGVGPALGFGIMPTKFSGVVQCLKSCLKGSMWDDFVPLESEAPKQQPFFVATDERLMLFVDKIDSWRLEAMSALRHVQARCTYFDSYSTITRPGPIADVRFIAKSSVRDPIVSPNLPNPRPDGRNGTLFIGGVVADRRSVALKLGLMPPPGTGPTPPLPPTTVHRDGLQIMYVASGMRHAQFDEILVGSDRYISPGLPSARAVVVTYHNVHIRTVRESRFPSLEESSLTPPNSPNANGSKGVKVKSKKRSSAKKAKAPSASKPDSSTAVVE